MKLDTATMLQVTPQFNMTEMNDLHKKGLVRFNKHPVHDLLIWNYCEKVQYLRCWNSTLLQCRGIITDSLGKVIHRSLPKFFDIKQEKVYPKEMVTESYRVFDKVDGSLGILFYHQITTDTGEWILASKGNFRSEQAIIGREILNTKFSQYTNLDKNKSYVFEIIHPKNKIIVNYGDAKTLIYITSFYPNGTESLDIDFMRDKGFEVVEELRYTDIQCHDLAKVNIKNKEGFVVLFSSGLRLKIKFSNYIELQGNSPDLSPHFMVDAIKSNWTDEEILEKIPDEFHQWSIGILSNIRQQISDIKNESYKMIEILNDKPQSSYGKIMGDFKYKSTLQAILNAKNMTKRGK